MYKSKEFDYDLRTTDENGTKRYWARVRATGEVTEISHEVMCFLRSEEKRLYREIAAVKKHGSTLSLDVPHDEEKESWYEDHGLGVSEIETSLFEEEFRKLLTPNQHEIFEECLLGNCGVRKFALARGIDPTTVSEAIQAIRKKFKKYFWGTPTNAQKMSVVG